LPARILVLYSRLIIVALFTSLRIYYSQINLTFKAIHVALLTVQLNKLSTNTQIDKYISVLFDVRSLA